MSNNILKDMDSIFADCTDDELEFDVLFGDDDDEMISIIAGLDEAGNPIAGPDFDWDAFDAMDEADDMVGENPDFEYQNDGDAAGSEKDAEGTKEEKLEVGGEVGDQPALAKQNSAESNADDVKDEEEAIGANDKQQTSLEATDAYVDNLLSMLEGSDPIEDTDDTEAREGKDAGVDNTEGIDQEVLGAAVEGENKEDPIADPKCPNDSDVRAGADTGVDNTEGVDTKPVGAALEADEMEVPEEGDPGDETDAEIEAENESVNALLGLLEAPDITDGEGEVTLEDAAEGPLEDDDVAEREGETDDLAVETESAIDSLLDMLNESDDPITDVDDVDAREGKDAGVDNTEGVDQEVLGAAVEGENKEDPIADVDDADAREGKDAGVDNTEGVDTEPIGAALEAADDFIDNMLNALNGEETITGLDDEAIVPKSVVQDLTHDGDIKVNEAAAEEVLEDDDQDDEDIEAIDSEKPAENADNVEYDYDDDELIDAVINGDIEALPSEE